MTRSAVNHVLVRAAALGVSLALATGFPALSATAAGSGQPAAAAIPKVKKKSVKLSVDVAGYIRTEQLTDRLGQCTPGVRYRQTNEFVFETGKAQRMKVSSVSLPGRSGAVVTSNATDPAKSASVRGAYSDYQISNYCAPTPPDPEPLPPQCGATTGKVVLRITPGDVPDDSGDLLPLKGQDMMLSVQRVGGKADHSTCVGAAASSITGPSADSTVLNTSMQPGMAVIVPTGLDGVRLFNLKRKVQKSVVMEGPCTKVNVKVFTGKSRAPAQGVPNRDGDCWLSGKAVLTIKPRT
jgi:hypothetical protein